MRTLIFSSREICYFSGNFFAIQMGQALEGLGHEVEVCELAKEDDLDEKLERYRGNSYDFILDFNSLLPRMAVEDGSLFVDQLNGPFYNWILDHPLFHHVALETKMKNSNAIFLDASWRDYAADYYPEVKQKLFLPLAATESFIPVEKKEKVQIFFPATYGRLEDVTENIKAAPKERQRVMKDLIERRIADPNLPMEEAYRQFLSERGEERDERSFREEMNAMYPVDAYVRNYYRKWALDSLLDAKIPVKVMGHGWEKYHAPLGANLTIEKPVFFHLTFEKMAREHVLLDVAPIFPRGVHDRVFAGMANRAAVLTEENSYKKENLSGEVLCYSLADGAELAAKAEELLTNRTLREGLQERAYCCYRREHTWQRRAEELIAVIAQGNRLQL